MPHPSTNHLISRVRDFIRWQEKLFGDPSARGAPLEDPPGWAPDKEFWIRNTVWRETIFEGNNDDATAAADALIDHSLLRAKQWESSSEVRERTVSVRVREKIFRAFVVNKSILAWRGPSPARFDEILARRAFRHDKCRCSGRRLDPCVHRAMSNGLPWRLAQANITNGEPRQCLNQSHIDLSEERVR
jgi:hypothetical protein